MSRASSGRLLALSIATILVAAPAFVGPAASSPEALPLQLPFATGAAIDVMSQDARSILRLPPPRAGVAIDDPGPAYGFPYENTLGFTTRAAPLDDWRWEWEGPLEIDVDMGKLTKKADIASEQDYILEIYFDLVGWSWFDGDGVFDPAPGNGNGAGDDPCPQEPMRLFDVRVNGVLIRTVEGHGMEPCAPGGPESSRTFYVTPVGNDLPNQVRVPKSVIREGTNRVSLVVHDLVSGPPNNPYHSEAYDGWEIYVDAVAIELAAPPLVLSHGWTTEWAPPLANAPWQPTFKANILGEFAAHTGQDPWRWAHLQGKDAILLNKYDRKQDFRGSARELRANVQSFHGALGFSGKGWMHGHSMGGLVSRYYVEVLGGNAKIEKLAQTGTPNLGSWEAHPYTYAHWMLYEAVDGEYTAKWHWTLPGWPVPCCVKVWHGWRDWWTPAVWAYERFDGAGHGRDHLADFGIKPEGSNPVLQGLNGRFPAPGVEYFTVRGDCNAFTSTSCALSGPLWRGDGAVGLNSATMNGAIWHRTIDAFHEDIPAQADTARWMVRYWGGLDLDSGKPLVAGLAEVSFAPQASDLELRERPDAQSGAAYLLLTPAEVAQGPYAHEILVDAGPSVEFLVLTGPREGPLRVTLRAPDGTLSTPEAQAPGVEHVEATGGILRGHRYGVAQPEPGTWTLLLEPGDVPPAEGLPLYVSAFFPGSATTLTARTQAAQHRAGDTAILQATLRGGSAIVTAATVDAMGVPSFVQLLDDGAHDDGLAGDGVYAARVPAGAAEGATLWRIVAEGADFRRETEVEVLVSSTPDLRLASLSGGPAGSWGGDAVSLVATIVSEGERAYHGGATVRFYDGDPQLGGVLLGVVDLDGALAPGDTRTATLDATAPLHEMTLFAIVDGVDLELDLADNVASAPMPFVPSARSVAEVAGAPGAGPWLLGPATVTLARIDGSPGDVRYALDGAPARDYLAPFAVVDEGMHTLKHWSVDALGRVEPVRTVSFGVDLAAPVAALVAPAKGSLHAADLQVANPAGFTAVAGIVEVVVRADDAGSGVAGVRLWVGRDAVGTAAPGSDGLWRAAWDTTVLSEGWHTLRWEAADAAGRATGGEIDVYVLAGTALELERDPQALLARLAPEEE